MFTGRGRRGNSIHLPQSALQRREPVIQVPSTPTDTKHLQARQISGSQAIRRPKPQQGSRTHRFTVIASSALLAFSIAFTWPAAMGTVGHTRDEIWGIDQFGLKQALAGYFQDDQRPLQISLPKKPGVTGTIHYSIDESLQQAMQQELGKYRPDYGMVVAMDATTGQILTMTDFRRDGQDDSNMNLKATYPAASVFKTITAAAAIDLGKARADSILPYNGKPTSLYKKQVLKHRNNKWTQHNSLEHSFSKSVNTVFARLGLFTIGGEQLMDYADRFGFNHPIASELPLEPSSIEMNPADEWSVAETASGYTRGTNISPVHGAMMAAAIINDGQMPMPRLIDSITDANGILLFENAADPHASVVLPETASEMRKLMARTIKSGSASKQFRGFKSKFKDLEVGGKTGSLTGFNPKGKYDWFVGYASDGERKIAYAVLCINKEYWYVKSAHLARRLIENYFS